MKSAKVLVIHGDKSARVQFLQYLQLYDSDSLGTKDEAYLRRLIQEISPDIVVYHSYRRDDHTDILPAKGQEEAVLSGTDGGRAFGRQEHDDHPDKPSFGWVSLALVPRLSEGRNDAPSGRSGHSGHETLTPRELQVLELIDQGLTNREIAEKLRLKETTIKAYNNTIFSKLQAKNRIQAVINARELGLVPVRRT